MCSKDKNLQEALSPNDEVRVRLYHCVYHYDVLYLCFLLAISSQLMMEVATVVVLALLRAWKGILSLVF